MDFQRIIKEVGKGAHTYVDSDGVTIFEWPRYGIFCAVLLDKIEIVNARIINKRVSNNTFYTSTEQETIDIITKLINGIPC